MTENKPPEEPPTPEEQSEGNHPAPDERAKGSRPAPEEQASASGVRPVDTPADSGARAAAQPSSRETEGDTGDAPEGSLTAAADGSAGAVPGSSAREPGAGAGEPGSTAGEPGVGDGEPAVGGSGGAPEERETAGVSGGRVPPAKGNGKGGLPGWVVQGLVSASAIVLALVVGAILIIVGDDQVKTTIGYFGAAPMDTLSAAGTAVGEAYKALVVGALGGITPITESLTQATPLICGGLAVSLAFRTGLFNIGAQGQLIVGAILAGYVGFAWHLPPVLHLILALIAGLVGGAIWGGVVGVLKARTGAHEVIVTIMLNYVAIYLLQWLLTTKAFQRPGRADPISPIVDGNAQYPQFGDTRLHLGFLLALAAAVGVWWLLNRSTIGFELRAVGANADASRTAGMSVGRAYVVAMVVAGALAGLAGTQQVLGTDLPLTDGVAASIGFDAITVALLGRGTPLGTVLAGLLFGALNAGGLQMQLITQTPLTLTTVLQAVIVLFVAAPALVRSVFRFLPKERGTGAVLAKGWNG